MLSLPNLSFTSTILAVNGTNLTTWPYITPKDRKFLSTKRRQQLEDMIQAIALRLGVRKQLSIIEYETPCTAYALGCQILPLPAAIVINTNKELDEDFNEIEFIIAHEISHIKSSDALYKPLLNLIAATICIVALSIIFPLQGGSYTFLPDTAIEYGFLLSAIPLFWLSRRFEMKADREGFKVCSQKGQEKAIKLFEKEQEKALELRNLNTNRLGQFVQKCLIDDSGESRINFSHPKFSDRILQLLSLRKKFEDIV